MNRILPPGRLAFQSLLVILISLFSVNFAHAQTRIITGTITDEKGETLPGVSIKVKGADKGASSDVSGKYKISLSADAAVLQVSYVGMQTREIKIGSTDNIVNVSLRPSANDLDAVVVVGYGSTKKSDLTGSVGSLKGSDLNRTPASSVDQLLQGKIAGVQVMTGGGQPGAGATIRIRGASTISGSSNPLVVVDGYPWGDAGNLKQINPEDIESIEVLKDASSAAIYGSRGANGVIMVTTKRGTIGKTRLSFSTLQTMTSLSTKPDVWRDPVEQATYENEAFTNANRLAIDIPWTGRTRSYTLNGKQYDIYYPSIAELRGLETGKPQWPINTNWVDLVTRSPISQNYTLSADGGSDKTKYSISGNYYDEQGLVINNSFKKYSGRLNLDQTVSKYINVGANIVIAQTNDMGQNLGVGRSPIWPVYSPDGGYFRVNASDFSNPVALSNQLKNTSKTVDAMGGAFINAKITPWLQLKSTLNAKYGNVVRDVYDPLFSTLRANQNGGGYAEIRNENYTDLLSETYFTLNKSFGTNHRINVVGGTSFERNEYRWLVGNGGNFVNDVLLNQSLKSAVTMRNDNGLEPWKLFSYYGRINYALKDKYLFTFTGRADGSTKFGTNNKWGYFPSGAFAWRASEEAFIKKLETFSDLKFRVSYGSSGNQTIGPFGTVNRYGSNRYWTGTAFQIGFGPGLSSGNDAQGRTIVRGLGNADLKWETTDALDFGVDIGVLNQRVTLTADFYSKKTHGLARERTISPSAGFDRINVNDGELTNKGFELGLNGDVLRRKDLSWSLGLNFSHNKNTVTSMGENNMIFTGEVYEAVRQQISTFTVNQPVYAFYGYKTDGIIQTEAEGLAAGLTGLDAMPGEIKYLDISGANGAPDGVIDELDRTIIGNPTPDFYYSFNTNVKFKQFDLSAQFYGVKGNDVWDFSTLTPSRQLQRWTVDNPSNSYPRAREGRGFKASDFYLADGSFLRIQNVTVGYNLPSNRIKGVKSLRVYLSGNNLYTFSEFNKGFDPEVGENGISNGAYPRARALSLGLNVGF